MKKSFTLIELLIVIVIIGILVVLALPKYNMMVKRSQLAGMLNVCGALRQAVQVYRVECGHAPLIDPSTYFMSGVWALVTSEKVLPLGIDLPFDKYQIWWTTASNDDFGRLTGMDISVDNMAFLVGYLHLGDANGMVEPGITPEVIMSEAGRKRTIFSGNVNNSDDWGPVE